MAKAMSLLRGQRNFLFEVDAELERMLIANQLAAKAKAKAKADVGGKATRADKAAKSLKTRTDMM